MELEFELVVLVISAEKSLYVQHSPETFCGCIRWLLAAWTMALSLSVHHTLKWSSLGIDRFALRPGN